PITFNGSNAPVLMQGASTLFTGVTTTIGSLTVGVLDFSSISIGSNATITVTGPATGNGQVGLAILDRGVADTLTLAGTLTYNGTTGNNNSSGGPGGTALGGGGSGGAGGATAGNPGAGTAGATSVNGTSGGGGGGGTAGSSTG